MSRVSRRLWTDHVQHLEEAQRLGIPTQEAQPTKYRNCRTVVDEIRFASKLEADRYRELKALKASGEVLWFLMQVPFIVAPGVLYRADFLVLWNDRPPGFSVEDCKGFMTPTSRVKIAAVQERYNLRITILTRSDVSRP